MKDTFIFRIITPHVPLEIDGLISGTEFYYRGRFDRWSIYTTVIDYAHGHEPIASGPVGYNGQEYEIQFALGKIIEAMQGYVLCKNLIFGE